MIAGSFGQHQGERREFKDRIRFRICARIAVSEAVFLMVSGIEFELVAED